MKINIVLGWYLLTIVTLLFGCNSSLPIQPEAQPTTVTVDINNEEGYDGIVYQSGTTLWLLNPEEKTKERLLEPVNYASAVSNDLSQVAYSTNSQDLWIVTRGQRNTRQVLLEQLPQLELSINRLVWSPQDDKLAILAAPQDNPQSAPEESLIFVVDIDQENVSQVGCGTDFEWGTNGEYLVLNKTFCADGEGIYLVEIENLASRPIFDEHTNIKSIAVSPTEEKIAFIAGEVSEQSIYIGELATGATTRLLDGSTINNFQSLEQLAWSPDGQELAVIATTTGENNLATPSLIIINLTTQDFREIASPVRVPLAWSPSSDVIATTVLTSTTGIYQIDAISGQIQILTDDRLATPINFMWK